MAYSRFLQPLVVVSSLAPLSVVAYPQVGDDQCDCYLTNASNGHYFTTHKFFDFREKSDSINVTALINSPDATSDADATNDYFQSDEWTQYWSIQSWNNAQALTSNETDAAVFMVHSPNNIYIDRNQDVNPDSSTFLTLRTARLKDFQSAAEFESNLHNYHYLSSRMYARTIGAPGAVTAMFTYRDGGNDSQAVQESDIEFRTIDPSNRIQYTNQPSTTADGNNIEEATRNATIPNHRSWSDWAVYRMDWTPGSTTWFIDGNEIVSISLHAPRDPSMLIFNSWSNGGSWTGNMSVGAEALLQIQWIDFVYNTTDSPEEKMATKRSSTNINKTPVYAEKRDEASCHNICSIDETDKTGTPVMLQSGEGSGGNEGSASRMLEQAGGFGTISFWVAMLSMALAFW
ncbi:hypothetical protein AAE478_003068 [Parahypoxylon ruwenzoriense]